MTEGCCVDGTAKRPEIMVVAYSLELPRLSVEEETFVRDDFYGPDAECGHILICLLLSDIYACDSIVQSRRFWRPQ